MSHSQGQTGPASHLVAFTEILQLRIRHDLHILDDILIVAGAELRLFETMFRHNLDLVVGEEPSEEHRVARSFPKVHQDV